MHDEFFRELYAEAVYYALNTHPNTTFTTFLLHVIYNPTKYDMSIFYLADFFCRLDIDTEFVILKTDAGKSMLERYRGKKNMPV